MSLNSLFSDWRADPNTAPNISTWRILPARPAVFADFPADLPPQLVAALRERGLSSLYSHQAEAWKHTRAGENVVLATGTASGKTLAYNLPVLATLLENPDARALYLFPTKALTQDQLSVIGGWSVKAAIYDGDTSQTHRKSIRSEARIILSNPDMLHTGILPHHTNWADFFGNLRFVVIDEMHTYRGVFGSHVANVLRRLKRVANFYGAHPQFILTSATIGNPAELAERLIEAPITLLDVDGSARGERHFMIYNPPVIDAALGLRKSAVQESVRLSQDLLAHDVQSVVFARSRRGVEMLLKYLQENREKRIENSQGENNYSPLSALSSLVRGYRSGYLPGQRREIEKGLRDGSVKLVVATNALELGIDIGGLGAAMLVGYPGSIASVTQQAGRAGRGDDPAAAILVATASPLDQFLAHHPEYFFARSPEQALVNPDHLLILLNHLRCALFELPFKKGEFFGSLNVDEFMEFLVANHESHLSNDKYFWMADAYPAAAVSLRSASPENIVLHAEDGSPSTGSGGAGPRIIGEIDLGSAPWMVHPHAVYLHEGQQYFVQELNFETHAATLIPVALDYFTEPLKETSIQVLAVSEQAAGRTANKAYGELQVTTQVTGFRKRMWFTGEHIGQEPLDLPPSDLQTTGYWIVIADETVQTLSKKGLWTNAPNDYGPEWPKIRERARARDGFRCQVCGRPEGERQHDVHHKTPFRQFMRFGSGERFGSGDPNRTDPNLVRAGSPDPAQIARANQLDNLVTLCPECHKQAEQNVRMRSGLAGLASVLGQLAPLFLMCDSGDLGMHYDPQADFAEGQPAVVLYDLVPAGIGFSQKLFEIHAGLLARALELVIACPCEDGCPSCVGPAGENGLGGKRETIEMLKLLVEG